MPRLTLVRHAKSSWEDAHLPDFDRPLGPRGLRDGPKMQAWIAENVSCPDVVLVSAARRTRQTSDFVLEAFDPPPDARVLDELYLAQWGDLISVVGQEGDGLEHVMVVAHNPGLTELYNHLVGEPLENFPTFGVADLHLRTTGFIGLPPGCAKVLSYQTPKGLKSGR